MMMEAGRVNRGILIHEGAQLSSKALEAIQEVYLLHIFIYLYTCAFLFHI